MIKWETTRHQVAISGQVAEEYTRSVLSGAQVRLENAPPGFLEQTQTAADGRYWFMDLPDGQYTLQVSLSGSGIRYGTGRLEGVQVSRDDGRIIMAKANITVPATTLKGTISDEASGDPIQMASVRVKGSGEQAYSDKDGNYHLSGLEATAAIAREVVVSARNYQESTRKISIKDAGGLYEEDFVMKKT